MGLPYLPGKGPPVGKRTNKGNHPGTYPAPQAPSRAPPGEGDMGEGLPHAWVTGGVIPPGGVLQPG